MMLLLAALLVADPEDRFLDNYPSQVGKLKQELAEARGVATVRSVTDSKLGPPVVYQFATGPGRRKFEFERDVQMPSGTSSVNRYGYAVLDGRNVEVQRTGPSEPYVVRGIGDDDLMRRAVFDAVFGKYLEAPWGFDGYDIANAVARGWFEVTEAREVQEQGRDLVEVTFLLTTMEQPIYYRVAFDPTLHWAITRASTWGGDPSISSERYDVTYGPTDSGRPYMRTLRWWGLDGEETLCEFGPVEFEATPAPEFTLEHYGLKSPPLPDRGPNYPLLIAILTLAVVLLIAAWFARRLAMRRA